MRVLYWQFIFSLLALAISLLCQFTSIYSPSRNSTEEKRTICKIIVHNPLCFMIMSKDGVHQSRFEMMKLRCIEGEIMRQVIHMARFGVRTTDMALLEGHSLFEYCVKVLRLTPKASALYFKMYILAPPPYNIRALDPKYHGLSLTKGRGLISKNLRRRRTRQIDGNRTDYTMVNYDAIKAITKAEKPSDVPDAIDDAIQVLKSKMPPVSKSSSSTTPNNNVNMMTLPTITTTNASNVGSRKRLFFQSNKHVTGDLSLQMKNRWENNQKNSGNKNNTRQASSDEVEDAKLLSSSPSS